MTEPSRGYVGTQDDVVLARVGAFVLDYVVSLVCGAALGFGLAVLLDSAAGVYLGLPLGLFAYYVGLEWRFGRTLGKRAAGIVVVSRDGGPITLRQSAVRNALRVVDGLFNYAVGLVVMLTNDDVQRFGDMVADTLVVRARR